MYTLEYTGQFRKDLKRVAKQGLDIVYDPYEEVRLVRLVRTGSHAKVLKK